MAILSPRKLTHLGQARGWAAVEFGASSLDLTTARAEGGELNVLQQSSASASPPEGGAPDAPLQWQSAAQSLRDRFDPREHHVVTSVSCEDVLCHILRLPATEPGELKQMLDLQIDGITPLPLEEVVYSFEPLEIVEGQTRVLVAIARKATVNERIEALETAGLQAEIVSVDALAMFRALTQRSLLAVDDKLNVLVILGAASANVIVYSQGAPLAVRSIVLGAEAESMLREELQRTLIAAEAGQTQRALGGVTFLAQGESTKAFAEKVASGLNAQSSFLTNGAVPSAGLSLCLQCVGREVAALNLLPDEWRRRRRTAALRQRLIRGAIAVGVAYALVLAVFLTFLAVKKAQLHRVQNDINTRQSRFSDAKQLQGTLITMRKQLDLSSSALEVLREVASRLPDNVKLNYFQYKKDQTVTLKAQAPSQALALDFQSRLEKCELFSKVVGGQTRVEPGSGLTKFDVTCTLKSAALVPATGAHGH
jgi:type IV pilus assembly protein PilM